MVEGPGIVTSYRTVIGLGLTYVKALYFDESCLMSAELFVAIRPVVKLW